MKLKVLRAAREDIRAAMRWYESRETGLGLEFVAMVDGTFRRIAERPEACSLWRADRRYRKRIVRRFPYTVFFEVHEQTVTIVAVAHQRRRPGYWRDR